jgi:hypothetical protein
MPQSWYVNGYIPYNTINMKALSKVKLEPSLGFVYAIWVILFVEFGLALFRFQWLTSFVALGTFVVTLLPFFLQKKFKLSIPNYFIASIVFFIAATLFFGEESHFYYKFWWWDSMLHGFSAIGFGVLGFIIMVYLCQSSKLKASPFLIALFSFSFALAIGALWEIFEFAMDQTFGTSMQKSGLPDTMKDLIVDSIGGIIASISGYLYLCYGKNALLSSLIHPVLKENKKIFRTKITKIEQIEVMSKKKGGKV